MYELQSITRPQILCHTDIVTYQTTTTTKPQIPKNAKSTNIKKFNHSLSQNFLNKQNKKQKTKKYSNFRTLHQPNQCIQNLILRIIKLKANIRIEANAKKYRNKCNQL